MGKRLQAGFSWDYNELLFFWEGTEVSRLYNNVKKKQKEADSFPAIIIYTTWHSTPLWKRSAVTLCDV